MPSLHDGLDFVLLYGFRGAPVCRTHQLRLGPLPTDICIIFNTFEGHPLPVTFYPALISELIDALFLNVQSRRRFFDG